MARASITVRVLRRLPARWIGECRRRAPTAHPSTPAALGKMARGVGGGGEAAGECTWLSAASYAASCPLHSARCFGVCLHARGCAVSVRLCGAAQRYPSLFWTAPSAPRSSSSAMTSVSSSSMAQCSGVHLHGKRRRGLGRRTHADRRKRKRRTILCPGRSRRRRIRQAIGRFGDCRIPPHSAARCCQSCARRGRGEGWAPRGYPSPQPVPETQNSTQAPRVSRVFVFGNR